uniref:RNA polymerase I and III subunit D, gene 1 n=1 Tax=Xenopus tropicalis TaxID=8364 RepID=A0A6I8PUL4_XENTR
MRNRNKIACCCLKAVEELLKEAKRGKIRAETMGPMGWMKCPLAPTNKRFLINTIKNTLPAKREKDPSTKTEQKESEDRGNEKGHSRKHRTHPYKNSTHSRKEKSHSPPHSKHNKEK